MANLRWFADLLGRIDRALPFLCDCGHFCPKRDACTEVTTYGKRVTYCPGCHREYFPERYTGERDA